MLNSTEGCYFAEGRSCSFTRCYSLVNKSLVIIFTCADPKALHYDETGRYPIHYACEIKEVQEFIEAVTSLKGR